MPTYDYRCQACGHEFEMFQQMSEGPARKCPGCGKLKLRRLMGAGGGIIFKGSGFYETDYKRKSGSNGTAGTKPAPAESSSSGKSDSSGKDSGPAKSPAPANKGSDD